MEAEVTGHPVDRIANLGCHTGSVSGSCLFICAVAGTCRGFVPDIPRYLCADAGNGAGRQCTGWSWGAGVSDRSCLAATSSRPSAGLSGCVPDYLLSVPADPGGLVTGCE